MNIHLFKNFLNKVKNLSVRTHLILGVTIVHGVLMAGFILDHVFEEKKILYNQISENAFSLSSTLAVTTAPWTHSRDLAGLDEIIQSFLSFKNINYAFIQALDGKVLAHTQHKYIGKYVSDEKSNLKYDLNNKTPQLVFESDNDIEYASPILLGVTHIGWARVSLNKNSTKEKIREVLYKGIIYAILAIIAGGLLARFVSRFLIYQLNNLVQVAENIKNGNLSSFAEDTSQNEIGKLAQAFNQMMNSINENKQRLVQSAKMVSLGEMASGIAHEINNPLAVIHGRAQRIQIHAARLTKEEILVEIEKINSMSLRIAKIVKGLKSFSRDANNDPFAPIPINDIIMDSINLCSEKIKTYGVDLQIQPIKNIIINCRSVQISQVLINLISNSLDAVANLENKWIQIKTETQGDLLILSIQDSGNGIPIEIIDKIMQPFFTTKEAGNGTGLGLSISKGIIESHGGKLYLDPKQAHTCFKIELPIIASSS